MIPSSRRTRSRISLNACRCPAASGTESAALSSCFCSSRWMRACSSSRFSMMLMPFTIRSASIMTFTATPPSSMRARSEAENGALRIRLEPLDQHDGAPLVVVELALLARQGVDPRLGEAALDEPVLGARGEHEQALQIHPAPARLDLGQ